MKRLIILALILFSRTATAERQAYVVNSLAETLSLIDLETGIVENHIVTLGNAPNQAVYHDGYIYVVNSVSADIMKIDPQARQVVSDIYLPIGCNPYYASFEGNFAYVTGFISGKVYKVDLTSGQVAREAEIGGYPEGILCHNGHVYATQTNFNPDDWSYGQGKVKILDAETLADEGQVNVGINPQWIGAADDGKLHIVCTGNYADITGSVYVLDPVAGSVVDSVNIGGQPANLAVSPLGIGYLAAGGWADAGYVYAYDLETLEIISGPDNPILAGLGVTNVAVDSPGYVYTCDMGEDTVDKLTSSGNPLGSFGVGDGPVFAVIIDDAVLDTEPGDNVSIPVGFGSLANYPNPFNGGTMILFESNNKGAAPEGIDILDILGRKIRSIAKGTEDNVLMVYWDGRDDGGKDCGSGVYFARIKSESDVGKVAERAWGRKMILIR